MKLQFALRITPRLHPFTYGASLGRMFYNRVPSYRHHDDVSQHSIGWIHGPADATRHGLVFSEPATWSLGIVEEAPLQEFLQSVEDDPEILDGVAIDSVTVVQPPTGTATYFAESPILLRDGSRHVPYTDAGANDLLTRNVRHALGTIGLPDDITEDVSLRFAPSEGAKTKVVTIGKAKYRANVCPVEVSAPLPGVHDAIMSLGVGGLTGMGLGAVIPMAYAR